MFHVIITVQGQYTSIYQCHVAPYFYAVYRLRVVSLGFSLTRAQLQCCSIDVISQRMPSIVLRLSLSLFIKRYGFWYFLSRKQQKLVFQKDIPEHAFLENLIVAKSVVLNAKWLLTEKPKISLTVDIGMLKTQDHEIFNHQTTRQSCQNSGIFIVQIWLPIQIVSLNSICSDRFHAREVSL